METSLPVPTTLPEVEHLINELYKPNPPETISQIQETLQRLQKSPQGWQLAQSLLARLGDNIKFFGALTIIVKLNTERLSDDDALSVLQNLITWLIHSLGDGSGPIVIRKLCSALVTYYIHYSHTWSNCIRHLIHSLDRNAVTSIEEIGDSVPLEQIIAQLDTQKFLAASWFATALAEETEKVDTKSTKYIGLHERVLDNANDVASLMASALAPSDGVSNISSQREALICLQAWFLYAQRTPKQPLIQLLQALVPPVINCLLVDELYETTVELLTDTLGNWQQFFTRHHIDSFYALFESDWARQRYQDLVRGDFDFDAVQFGLFMLAFGDAQMVEMMDSTDTRAQAFLTGLAGLLIAKGHPAAEDKIFVPALELWSAFVENLVDTLYSESTNDLPWDKPPLSQVMQVVSYSWQKIQYPSSDVYNSWDSTEKAGFGDARKDVADFLQAVYTILGLPLISLFVDLILRALADNSWAELEAASFCLGALSDSVSEGNSYDETLTKVFGSSLFDLLRQGQGVVPVRSRQTCLYLIERYSEYFVRHAEYLPAALNLLFSAVADRHLALPSSKSILTLCSSCRRLLTSEIDAFLEQYSALRNNRELDSLAEERVIGAIAAIIQSLPSEEHKLNAVQRLLTMVGMDVSACLQFNSAQENALVDHNDPVSCPLILNQHEFPAAFSYLVQMVFRAYDISQRPTSPVLAHEVALQFAVRALRCLCSIAKGLQAPVDLDSDDESVQVETRRDLERIHADIIGILVQLKDLFSSSAEVVDAICTILRAGFSETDAGPFVFPPPMVTELITSNWQSRIATVVNTANIFASSLNAGRFKQHAVPTLGILLPWVFNLLHQLPGPEAEPELSQYGIEFAQRVLLRRPEVLMSQAPNVLEFLFSFAMKLLNGNEPLPKAAAAEFWTTFITAKSDDANVQVTLNDAMMHFGPQLSQSLMQSIGGRASRSDLDKLSEPLKKLIVQHVYASKWLEAALNDVSFPSDKVSPHDKALFVKKLVSLRGAKATNQVVRDFWLACRGSNFAYAS
ncbi:armadillo-type protein [Xylaria bambusicola]|uniref:armadillo-type protein n=1 Tax=Xylaria bambusicola TaxID=326684 RepID=UPI0020078988|nr:armadillo-type protein [Xylaria bambusicola]KAI0526345.1 armadillo-type protein [Xylaria bambusicola]